MDEVQSNQSMADGRVNFDFTTGQMHNGFVVKGLLESHRHAKTTVYGLRCN